MGALSRGLRVVAIVLFVFASIGTIWFAFWLLGLFKLLIVVFILWLLATTVALLHAIIGHGGTDHHGSKHAFKKIGGPERIVDTCAEYPPDDDMKPSWA